MTVKEKKKKKPKSAYHRSVESRAKAEPPPLLPAPLPHAPFGFTTRGKVKLQPGKGHPNALPQPYPDDPALHAAFLKTVNTVSGLGLIWATTKECAAVLNVSEPTFINYAMKHEDVRNAYERGRAMGRVSLRRHQMALAEKNAAMAIFLGKNQLGQKDQQYIEQTVRSFDLSSLSDEELAQLEKLSRKIGTGEEVLGEDIGVTYFEVPGKPEEVSITHIPAKKR